MTGNEFVINSQSIYQVDWATEKFVRRFEIEGDAAAMGERFSDSLNIAENVTTLLSNRHLYIFRTIETTDIDSTLQLRGKLSLDAKGDNMSRKGSRGNSIQVLELIDGYLVSVIADMPPRFSTLIDFDLYGRSELLLYKTIDSLSSELVNRRPLNATFSYYYVFGGFMASSGIWLVTNAFDTFYFVNPDKNWWPPDLDIPLSALILAALVGLCSALGTHYMLRNAGLPGPSHVAWVVLNGFTGLIGLLSLCIGVYFQAHELAAVPQLIARDLLVPAPSVHIPVLSPDGKFVVYGERDGLQYNLKILNTRTREAELLFNTARLRNLFWSKDSQHIIFELDNAIGHLSIDSQNPPSYISMLDRAKGHYFLGPDVSSPEHVLLVRKAADRYSLERISFSGQSEEIFSSSLKIVNAVYSANDDSAFIQLMSAMDQNIYQLREGALEEIVPCGVLDECFLDTYDAASQTLWLRLDVGIDHLSLFSWSAESRQLQLAQ